MDHSTLSLPLARAEPVLSRRALYFAWKRGSDALLAFAALIVSLPFWGLIAAAIWLEDRGPVFFCKECVSQGGGTFRQIKFRTMIPDAERDTGPVLSWKADPRITRVGRWLRKTALDELPQLVNILLGQMSWVGPRPQRAVLVRGYLREIPNYGLRHLVRPGLTGLAQVYGRYHTPPRQKLRYDLLYLRRCNAWLDARLFAASFWVTFKGRWDSRARRR
jgi:lipopolysaccharide/colanic/teichoic acid biosynthesis glycosyltransferase